MALGIYEFFNHKNTNVTLALFVFFRSLIIAYLFLKRDEVVTYDKLYVKILAYISTFLPLLYLSDTNFFSENINNLLKIIIIVFYSVSIYSLLSLGKSFGISPAKRKIVKSGIYAYLNHPAYWGYAVSESCILILNFNLINLGIFLLSISMYYYRAIKENEILNK